LDRGNLGAGCILLEDLKLVYNLVLLLNIKLLKDLDVYVALKQQTAMLVNQEFRQVKLLYLLLLLIIDGFIIFLLNFCLVVRQGLIFTSALLNLADDGLFDYVVQELLGGLGIVDFLFVFLPPSLQEGLPLD